MKNSQGEFRKVAKDAIERIEEDIDIFKKLENISESSSNDLPLIAMNIPSGFVFKYPSLEGESKLDGTIRIAKGVIIEDSGDGREKNGLRKVMVELENHQNVSVSIDILFRCLDRTTGETRSAWLQLASKGYLNGISADKATEIAYEMDDSKKLEKNILSPKDVEKIHIGGKQNEKSGMIDGAVKLLSDIGLSGVANAATTVTQLSGQEVSSKFRTIPIEQLYEEIVNLGDSIVLIEVRLHGTFGDMNGKMQLYLSKDTGIDIANELLCKPPESFCEDFNEDIISTLKETANIFGGQYVSAISEYIGVPILLDAPKFEIGDSSKVVEAVIKEVNGKVEFVLATDLSLGKDKTGRLVMLLDPKSYDIIVSKLF